MKRELNPKSIYNFDNLPKPKLNHKAEGLEYKATNGSFIDLQMINCFFLYLLRFPIERRIFN